MGFTAESSTIWFLGDSAFVSEINLSLARADSCCLFALEKLFGSCQTLLQWYYSLKCCLKQKCFLADEDLSDVYSGMK